MLFSACENLTNNATPACDLYQASLDASGTVTSVQHLPTLSDATKYDRHPTLSSNLLRMFFLRGGTIYVSSRPNVLGTFSEPSIVATIDLPNSIDADPFLSRTNTLFFMRGPANQRSIHDAQVNETSIDGAQQLSAQLTGQLLDPVMADVEGNAESLLFIAKIEGVPPQRRIYTSERTGATWSALTEKYVDALNVTETSNFVNWASPDSCRVYFSRGGSLGGGFKIYVADRSPL